MDKSLRLKKNDDFNKVYKKGIAAYNRDFTIIAGLSPLTGKRFGFSLSKKFGKAHERNRMKRRLKEIVRLNQQVFNDGYDYVIIPRQGSKILEFDDLKKSLFHCNSYLKKNIIKTSFFKEKGIRDE